MKNKLSDLNNYLFAQLECFWSDVKCNRNKNALSQLSNMRDIAEKAAAEWIQVAAMCYKAGMKAEE